MTEGRAPRKSIFALATMVCADGSERHARVRNIAAGGLAAEMARPVNVGERVVVLLKEHGPVAGHIAWRQGGRIGVTFDDFLASDAPLHREAGPAEHWAPLPMHRVTSDRSNRAALKRW